MGWRGRTEAARIARCPSHASGEQQASPTEAKGSQADFASGQQRGHWVSCNCEELTFLQGGFQGGALAEAPSALKPLEHIHTGEGRNAETHVPLAEASSAKPEWEDVADPPGAGSPTPLEVLAGHGVEAVADEATKPSARESPRISAATKILETEDDTPSEEEKVQSVRGTPTGVLCEQVVSLLRYLDRKATKYGDLRQCGSYVELVQNCTRIKVVTNLELMVLDQKYRQLEERYHFLQDQCALSQKLQKKAIQLRDEIVINARREIDELRAKVQTEVSAEQAQNRILADELV
ncbi:hypothetical protein AXG93_3084s1040 [Marchantia polymorpha subsp. ruderalis]|uniref:Uncharacterized protein n=1 Tax=Marchantia polymorpha subsp. ruderalis TaxID=1480154 RepID=A0A176VMA6_MARPO|nr:hypothetical protein AXG93_3084s1040 [Marchantia polymorpha subsp. ruderalis]